MTDDRCSISRHAAELLTFVKQWMPLFRVLHPHVVGIFRSRFLAWTYVAKLSFMLSQVFLDGISASFSHRGAIIIGFCFYFRVVVHGYSLHFLMRFLVI